MRRPGCPGGSSRVRSRVSVPTAGQCALGVTEPTAVGLPTTGTFGESAGGTSYNLSKGNWNLEPPPTGTQIDQAETYLTCTGGAALPGGDITLTCSITSCTQEGDDDDYSCNLMGSCQVQLTPSSADAASMVPVVDASVANHDAGTSRDGGSRSALAATPPPARSAARIALFAFAVFFAFRVSWRRIEILLHLGGDGRGPPSRRRGTCSRRRAASRSRPSPLPSPSPRRRALEALRARSA